MRTIHQMILTKTMGSMALLVQINAFGSYQQATQGLTSSHHTNQGSHRQTHLKMKTFDNLPNIFGDALSRDDTPSDTTPQQPPPSQSTEPEDLIRLAREILNANMGLDDPSLLDENFAWIGPDVYVEGSLNKQQYLAAANFFSLNTAFPDLNYRSHDYRINNDSPYTVRLTARTIGTMRGELRLRNDILSPNGKKMVCPPEAITMTFDPNTALLIRLCTGYPIDRLVGNTGGLCGVKGAATVAGAPPSEWEIYPPSQVVKRFFGRPAKPRVEPEVVVAPFPETVMIQLAKGVLAARNGVDDPSLLGETFEFSTPTMGPLEKGDFLERFGEVDLKAAIPDFDENYSNFRVDPYDPYRVWVDSRTTGTWTKPLGKKQPNGKKFISPAESVSLTFDDDGFCIRLTTGYVMDFTDSNTGGLGGIDGIYYAIGIAELPLNTRSLPQLISRSQSAAVSLFTGGNVDDLIKKPVKLPSFQPKLFTPKPPSKAPSKASPPNTDETDPKINKSATPLASLLSLTNVAVSDDKEVDTATQRQKELIRKQEELAAKREAENKARAQARAAAAEKRKADNEGATKKKVELNRQKAAALKAEKAEKAAALRTEKAEKAAALKAEKAAKAAALKAEKEAKAAALKAEKAEKAAALKAQREAEKAEKAAALMEKKDSSGAKVIGKKVIEKKVVEKNLFGQNLFGKKTSGTMRVGKKAEAPINEAKVKVVEKNLFGQNLFGKKTSGTMRVGKKAEAPINEAKVKVVEKNLFGQNLFGKKTSGTMRVGKKAEAPVNEAKVKAKAPAGVPELNRWKKNRDGSVTGFISGSSEFEEYEKVTTSPIEKGEYEVGSLVQTSSGSKYFLN